MPKSSRAARKKEKPARIAVYLTTFLLFVVFGVSVYLYKVGTINQNQLTVYASIAQSLIFSFGVFTYMLLTKGRTFKKVTVQLGLSSFKSIHLLYGVALFVAVLFLEFSIALFQAATGIQLPSNVSQIFSGLPLYFLLFSAIIVPINEEILFRGFMVPRLGIIISALIFAALHYIGYLSISEFVAALVFGILAGYVRKRTSSLYPSIIAHMSVNILGLLALALI